MLPLKVGTTLPGPALVVMMPLSSIRCPFCGNTRSFPFLQMRKLHPKAVSRLAAVTELGGGRVCLQTQLFWAQTPALQSACLTSLQSPGARHNAARAVCQRCVSLVTVDLEPSYGTVLCSMKFTLTVVFKAVENTPLWNCCLVPSLPHSVINSCYFWSAD